MSSFRPMRIDYTNLKRTFLFFAATRTLFLFCSFFTCSLPSFADAKSELYVITQFQKTGYINDLGTVIIPAHFDSGQAFSEGFAAVKVGKVWGYISGDGTFRIEPRFTSAGDFDHGVATVRVGKEWKSIDQNGAYIKRNWAAQSSKEASLWPDEENDDGKYGFSDANGTLKIPATFDSAEEFRDGFAAVERAGLWGFIDANGVEQIPLRYRKANDFGDGLAPVEDPELKVWGYIDVHGVMTIAPSYSEAGVFKNGVAVVRSGKRAGLIDRSGRLIIPTWYDSVGVAGENIWLRSGDQWSWAHKDGTIFWNRFNGATVEMFLLFFAIAFAPVAVGFVLIRSHLKALQNSPSAELTDQVYSLSRKIRITRRLSLLLLAIALLDFNLGEKLFAFWDGVLGELFLIPPKLGFYNFPPLLGSQLGKILEMGGLIIIMVSLFMLPAIALSRLWYRLELARGGVDVLYRHYLWRSFKMGLFTLIPFVLWGFSQAFVPDTWYWHIGSFLIFTTLVVALGPWTLSFALRSTTNIDSELEQRCRELSRRSGIKFQKIMICHFPSGKVANAMVTGILPFFRRVFVSDFLLRNCTLDEVETIIGHELGHIAKHHLLKRILASCVAFAVTYEVMQGLQMFPAFRSAPHSTLLVIWILILLPILQICLSRMSRTAEYEADTYAATITGKSSTFMRALQKIYLLNGAPNKLGKFARLMLSHPTIEERLAHLEKISFVRDS